MRSAKQVLKDHLRDHFYFHTRVLRMSERAEQVLTGLFEHHRRDPSGLPERMREGFPEEGEARVVADYIAGMTDRYALAAHSQLVDAHERH